MISDWPVSLFPKQLNSTVNSLLSFVRKDRIYFHSINLVSVAYYDQDGLKFICLLKMDSICLTPFQKQPLYKCQSINPWVTRILNSICSSSLPLKKDGKELESVLAFSKASSWFKRQFKGMDKKTGTTLSGKRDDGNGNMIEICKVRTGNEQVPRNQLFTVPSNTRTRGHHRKQGGGRIKAR